MSVFIFLFMIQKSWKWFHDESISNLRMDKIGNTRGLKHSHNFGITNAEEEWFEE